MAYLQTASAARKCAAPFGFTFVFALRSPPASIVTAPPHAFMYFLYYQAQNHGPYALDQIRSMWTSGIITADAVYWVQADSVWQPIAELLAAGRSEGASISESAPRRSASGSAPSPASLEEQPALYRRVTAIFTTIIVVVCLFFTHAAFAEAPALVNAPEQNRAWSRALGAVTATTSTTRHPTTVSRTAGTYTKRESHQTGVYVHFGVVSLKAVQSPYEVQCFFVSGGKGDVAARVYDQHRQVSELPVDAEFLSRSLAGKSTTITTSDIELRSTTSNRTYTGTLSNVSQSEGNRSGGWIVRVLVAGKVARVEASLSELKDYAVKNPEPLDAVIANVKPTAPAPDKKPATGLGSTSLDRK